MRHEPMRMRGRCAGMGATVRRAVVGTLALGCAAAVLTGCSSSSSTADRPTAWHALTLTLPASIAGFVVHNEPATAAALKTGGPSSLLTGGAVYSLRENNQLDAVLEVGELKATANADDLDFQRSVVGQIGQSVPRSVRVKGHTVYEGTAPDQQSIFSWFHEHRMYVLMTHGVKNPQPLLEGLLQATT